MWEWAEHEREKTKKQMKEKGKKGRSKKVMGKVEGSKVMKKAAWTMDHGNQVWAQTSLEM